MVVFTCNNCGDSLQKPKVAKHYQFQCRHPVFVTCVDCHKDFRGDEYTSHTKCLTENERYGGKDYKAKPSANKGERKQQAWLTIVQNVLENSTNLTVPERNLLNSISRHENIPRKKAKFFNFIKSLSGNRANMTIVEGVWDKMETAFKNATEPKVNGQNDQNNQKQNGTSEHNGNHINCNDNVENAEKIKENDDESENTKKKKKTKKRQLEADENDNETPAIKKINKTVTKDLSEEETVKDNAESKFSWKNTILEIVTTKEEISIKKLKKKVISKYLANFPSVTSDKAASKFEKKLGKVSNIVVANDKVRLCQL